MRNFESLARDLRDGCYLHILRKLRDFSLERKQNEIIIFTWNENQ